MAVLEFEASPVSVWAQEDVRAAQLSGRGMASIMWCLSAPLLTATKPVLSLWMWDFIRKLSQWTPPGCSGRGQPVCCVTCHLRAPVGESWWNPTHTSVSVRLGPFCPTSNDYCSFWEAALWYFNLSLFVLYTFGLPQTQSMVSESCVTSVNRIQKTPEK